MQHKIIGILMVRVCLTFFISIILVSPSGLAENFDIMELPVGKNVTLPPPARTVIPLTESIQLTATDLPQAIKLGTVHTSGGKVPPVKLAIYDRQSERVKYISLKPNSTFLYPFRALGSVRIVPMPGKNSVSSAVRLQVESNKPLGLSH